MYSLPSINVPYITVATGGEWGGSGVGNKCGLTVVAGAGCMVMYRAKIVVRDFLCRCCVLKNSKLQQKPTVRNCGVRLLK